MKRGKPVQIWGLFRFADLQAKLSSSCFNRPNLASDKLTQTHAMSMVHARGWYVAAVVDNVVDNP